ncbi:hypothetical protein H072_5095 [Dactylellina haptotyla CBS 200.50]|uniref:WSC domain-containing protein n=1 Tax=Dactylellina haptotyla (strain CBS 200.50) TaxID=1284197 RepID=S8C0A2_DACHA|nr:hypothetical protein H072_5095 [Dactylellina haptotyla CBS 200.50]
MYFKNLVAAIVAIGFARNAVAAPKGLVTELAPRDAMGMTKAHEISFAEENHVLKKRGYWYWDDKTKFFPIISLEFPAWKYVGCYSADINFHYNTQMCSCMNPKWNKIGERPFSMNKCFAMCKAAGYRYAAIKGGNGAKNCYCGNDVTDDTRLSTESKCNLPCGNDEGDLAKKYDANKCGGTTTWSVWKDPCFKPFDLETAPGGYQYVGCFYFSHPGSVLTEYLPLISGDNLSIDSCIEACSALGFAFSGMTAAGGQWLGNQCWCGGKVTQAVRTRHSQYPADNIKCTYLCSATNKIKKSLGKDDYQYCGNVWYMSLYYNVDLDYAETCDAGDGQKFVTSTTAGPKAGTTTIFPTSKGKPVTDSGTATVVVTTAIPQTQKLTTKTTTGPKPGTTTMYPMDEDDQPITNSGVATVVITKATQKLVSKTTGGPVAGTTTIYPVDDDDNTITDYGTATVMVTTAIPKSQKYTTIFTTGPEDGTATLYPTDSKGKPVSNSGTATVVVTSGVPDAGGEISYTTITTTGPAAGTETLYPTDDNGEPITEGVTATVVITSGVPYNTGKNTQKTTTIFTGGDEPGTATIYPTNNGKPVTTAGTATLVITTATKSEPQPTVTGDPNTVCTLPQAAAADLKKWKGMVFPLGGVWAPAVNCHDDKSKYKDGYHFKLFADEGASCRIDYKHTTDEISTACMNACIEQSKACKTKYAAKKYCSGGTCWETSVLVTQCQTQLDACKAANKPENANIAKANSDLCTSWSKKSKPKSTADAGEYYYRRR